MHLHLCFFPPHFATGLFFFCGALSLCLPIFAVYAFLCTVIVIIFIVDDVVLRYSRVCNRIKTTEFMKNLCYDRNVYFQKFNADPVSVHY